MFQKSFDLALLFVSFIELTTCQVINYCGRDLCQGTDYHHITCTATGDLMPSCPSDARVVDLSYNDVKQILELHNEYRNKLAAGNQPGYHSASRMTTMVSERHSKNHLLKSK